MIEEKISEFNDIATEHQMRAKIKPRDKKRTGKNRQSMHCKIASSGLIYGNCVTEEEERVLKKILKK